MDNIEQLKKDLALAEKNVTSPAITGNPELLKSLNMKISVLKSQIKIAEKKSGGSKVEAGEEKKASAKEPKSKKEKVAKAPKTPKEKKARREGAAKPSGETTKLKEGDKATWETKGEKKKGTVVRITNSYHTGKLVIILKDSAGKTCQAYASKVKAA